MKKKIQLACFAIVFFVIGYAVNYIITINSMIPVNWERIKPNIFGHNINIPDARDLYVFCHSKNLQEISYCYGYSDAMVQLAYKNGYGNCYDIIPKEITNRIDKMKLFTKGPATDSYFKALESFNCEKE